MYQQQGYANRPRSALHPPPQNNPHPIPPNMQPMGFQFSRPTQLPEELESALAIRSATDTDHRQLDPRHQLQQHQLQASGADVSKHGVFGSSSTNQLPVHQQPMHWPSSGQAGGQVSTWPAPVQDTTSSHPSHLSITRDGHSFHTPDSAGSILASFGLSSDDLEVLSHYPDDQLTPDTLPFILRDIQINKSGQSQLPGTSTMSTFSHGLQDLSFSSGLSRSLEGPSIPTVTQTPLKVIDYGHASRAQDELNSGERFKREPLSSERAVKMYPPPAIPKENKHEKHNITLETSQQRTLEDLDLRRTSRDRQKNIPPPSKDFQYSPQSHEPPRHFRTTPEYRSKSSSASKRSPSFQSSSSSGSRPPSGRRKLPTPTMISDFSSVSPKVYPHTCSLCDIQCDQEKDWLRHVDTVSHTARCRELRSSYPEWRPRPPRFLQSGSKGHHDHHASWDPKERRPPRHTHKSLSRSPGSSPPRSKSRPELPRSHWSDSKLYSTEHRARVPPHHSSSHPPEHFRQPSASREQRPSGVDSSGHRGTKRSHDDGRVSSSTDTHGSKRKQPQEQNKVLKGAVRTQTVSSKAPPAKKKKTVPLSSRENPKSLLECLVFLTGIPEHASEQDVTNLVGSFGKINNVILIPSVGGAHEQTASVCMMAVEDAQALANSTNLSIKEQRITASLAKKPESVKPLDAIGSPSAPGSDKTTAEGSAAGRGGAAAETTPLSCENGTMLITGLPDSGWTHSDIIGLVQPFWTPSQIVMATQIGKALVPVLDREVAQEMLKVHKFVPFKIKDCAIKLNLLKQSIDCSTPVSLFNLLMGSADPQQSKAEVLWNSLLVIRNVPNTQFGYREVQRLIQRFGTVIKTLVLQNMVICEMATAAIALSVYKRFQTFPCIIESNPLLFSRKADPKASSPQSKGSPAASHPSPQQKKHAKVQNSSAPKEEKSERKSQESEGSLTGSKKIKTTQSGKAEPLNGAPAKHASVKRHESSASTPSAPPSEGPDASQGVQAAALAKMDTGASVVGGAESLTVPEAETRCSDENAASKTSSVQQQPTAPEATASAPDVEHLTRSSSQEAAPEEQKEAPEEEEKKKEEGNTEQRPRKKARVMASEKKREESHGRKERESRERERAEKELSSWEGKGERGRREGQRKERSQRESGRSQRKPRDRENQDGTASSIRSEKSSLSSRRGHTSDAKTTEEEEEPFPFDMSDFVTVDEVGEAADLAACPASVATETPTSDEDVSTLVQHVTPEEPNVEASPCSVKYDEPRPEDHGPSPPREDTIEALNPPPQSTPGPTPSQQLVPGDQDEKSGPGTDGGGVELGVHLVPQRVQGLVPSDSPRDTDAPPSAPEGGASTEEEGPQREGEHTEGRPVDGEEHGEEPSRAVGPGERLEETQEHGMKTEGEPAPVKDTLSEEQQSSNTQVVTSHVETTKTSKRTTLPPFDPKQPVGLEYLVPKSGFFCRVCVRFFSSAKEAELNHCRTLKHYENLQNYLKKTGSDS